MNEQTVCAAVVAYRRPDELASLLASLVAQTRRPDALIVVDNSADASSEAADRAVFERVARELGRARFVVNERNTGSAGGFARAMSEARAEGHDYVWLLDQDGTADPGCLAALLAEAGRRAGALCPVVRAIDGGYVLPDFRCRVGLCGAVRPVSRPGARPSAIAFAGTHGILARGEAIDAVGVYDAERYFVGGEDFDWTARASRAGWPVLLVPGAVVRHPDLSRKRRMSAAARAARRAHHAISAISPQFLGTVAPGGRPPVMLAFHRERLGPVRYFLAVVWSSAVAAAMRLAGADVSLAETVGAYLLPFRRGA